MRVVRLEDRSPWEEYTTVSPITRVSTTDLTVASTWELADGTYASAACLRCWMPSCRSFSADEVPSMASDVHYDVCAVRALGADESGVPMFLTHCVSCGLCALRCPFGAIHLQSDGCPAVENNLDSLRVLSDESEVSAGRRGMEFYAGNSAEQVLQTAWHSIDGCLRSVDSAVFYPLVARLFCAIGLPTVDGRAGDTSLRMDAIGWYDEAGVPMEIKSYREAPEINIKAIQQAFENKVIALSSKRVRGGQTDFDSTSFAVGYAYPADRSGVMSLIHDYDAAFGVRIGIVTVRDLYIMLTARMRCGAAPDVRRLATLAGPWS